ncbi:teichoic acid D-Ala incorporation-associated protein DltX [Vagococcus jeotgali]|uniref:teichoic acid D-Ala incorporation-associated protein DltX n=1 Tax=Vagococcus jeotgali TaxID=3109030 RepID=UPI002DDB5595|nr:teichoic acid D-Ala incorporation-associated protein DltX [Vagococcus sp. B2T-5]
MKEKKNEKSKKENIWGMFILKTAFYTAVLLVLIYLYQYSQVGGGSFIYNQF